MGFQMGSLLNEFLFHNGVPLPHQVKDFLLKVPGKIVSSWTLT